MYTNILGLFGIPLATWKSHLSIVSNFQSLEAHRHASCIQIEITEIFIIYCFLHNDIVWVCIYGMMLQDMIFIWKT